MRRGFAQVEVVGALRRYVNDARGELPDSLAIAAIRHDGDLMAELPQAPADNHHHAIGAKSEQESLVAKENLHQKPRVRIVGGSITGFAETKRTPDRVFEYNESCGS